MKVYNIFRDILKPIQKSMMRLKAINYFHTKALLEMFNRVVNMPLVLMLMRSNTENMGSLTPWEPQKLCYLKRDYRMFC